MSTYAPPSDALRPAPALGDAARRLAARLPLRRATAFGLIMLGALAAFEVFNFSTTQFALQDMLGDVTFGKIRWATILALAFCGMDFAGIARIFTPEKGADEPAEVWYLFGAWFIAAAFNASLTWWGVSVAVLRHTAQGGVLLGQDVMIKVVPIMVAVMVLAIRVLLINTFSVAGERIFSMAEDRQSYYQNKPSYRSNDSYQTPTQSFPRPAPKPAATSTARSITNRPIIPSA
mgnify:CR=1 FL=1